jgi:hypothetical protein
LTEVHPAMMIIGLQHPKGGSGMTERHCQPVATAKLM